MTTISFEEVRKGDLVKVEHERYGVAITKTGRVDHTAGYVADWQTEEDGYFDMEMEGAVITLLERPKSREQELWEEVRLSGYAVEDVNHLPADHPVPKLINKIVAMEKATNQIPF